MRHFDGNWAFTEEGVMLENGLISYSGFSAPGIPSLNTVCELAEVFKVAVCDLGGVTIGMRPTQAGYSILMKQDDGTEREYDAGNSVRIFLGGLATHDKNTDLYLATEKDEWSPRDRSLNSGHRKLIDYLRADIGAVPFPYDRWLNKEI